MIEVLPRYETHFILLRKIHNRPGIAAAIIESLKNTGVDIENFQVVAHPDSEYADVLMLAVKADKAILTIESIKKADGKVGGETPIIVEDLVGIIIRGITIVNSTDVLSRAFKVCEQLEINISMAYTTVAALNIYIDAKYYSDRVIEELKSEFEKN